MPNWCQNSLWVRGSREDLEKFLEQSSTQPDYYERLGWSSSEEEYPERFCFSGTVPMPEDVIQDHSQAHDQIMLRQAVISKIPGLTKLLGSPKYPLHRLWDALLHGLGMETLNELRERRERWYKWSIQNWGTKWDLDLDVQIWKGFDRNPAEVRIEFDTAWAPPEAWLQTTAAMYPHLKFHLEYEETGLYFSGIHIVQGDCVVRDERRNLLLDEFRRFYPDWEWIPAFKQSVS